MNLSQLLLISLATLLLGSGQSQAQSRSESHRFDSAILAEAGVRNNRTFIVDLPDGYDTSGLDYPVIYMLHGWNDVIPGNPMGTAPPIADKLVRTNQMQPVILVRPELLKPLGVIRVVPLEQYVAQEIVPFVDANYRTIPRREARAIAGFSMGGKDAFYIALTHPDLFSLVGSYAGGEFRDNPIPFLLGHEQHRYPIQFWFWWGRSDNLVSNPRRIINQFEALDWPHFYLENDGNHASRLGPMEQSLPVFSERMWNDRLAEDFDLRSLTQTLTIAAASDPVALNIEVVLQQPASGSSPTIGIDLSAFGQDEPFALQHQGNGRYTVQPRVTVGQAGNFLLPVQRTLGPDGANQDPEVFTNITLQVFPAGDLAVFDQALAATWTQDANRRITPTATSFDGRSALQLESTGSWRLSLIPDEPFLSQGYEALTLAFHPAAHTLREGRQPQLIAATPVGAVDLLDHVELERQEWQTVTIPLQEFGLEPTQPLLQLRFTGNLEGTFYLGNLRFVREAVLDQPTVKMFSPPYRYVRGTETSDLLENSLPPTVGIEMEIASATETDARLHLDGTEIGLAASIALEPQGNGRYATALPIERSLSAGIYTLPMRLSAADLTPTYFAAPRLSIYPDAERMLFADDALPPEWEVSLSSIVTLDPQATDQIFTGQTSLAFQPKLEARSYYLIWTPASAIFGYSLHFAFHPGQTDATGDPPIFNLVVTDTWGTRSIISLLDGGDRTLDLQQSTWQTIDIPLGDQPIQSIAFLGNLKDRTFYLDDIRLIPQKPPTAPPTAVLEERQNSTPTDFALLQNYPNPFNSGTVIRFALPQSGQVDLAVFNLAGQQVATLVSGHRQAGRYAVRWDSRNDRGQELASGVYFYRLQVGNQVERRKLLLLH